MIDTNMISNEELLENFSKDIKETNRLLAHGACRVPYLGQAFLVKEVVAGLQTYSRSIFSTPCQRLQTNGTFLASLDDLEMNPTQPHVIIDTCRTIRAWFVLPSHMCA